MADNTPSKIQYDDFIANVQPDPAKPESTTMLSGFIGHGGDGVVRIYPDPSLGTWYDVPETDVVHSMAVPDSKLGGSYVWVRASAQIKPGSSAAAAAAAPAAQAAPNFTIGAGCTFICAQPGAGLQQPTPATHCFICPPHTQQCLQATPTADVTLATICTQYNQCLQPTPTVHQSLATVCTQFCPTFHAGCLTLPNNCFPITQPAVCTLAVSPNCPPPAPGTPVQQPAFLAVPPTPTIAADQCGGPTLEQRCLHLTLGCTAPRICAPSVPFTPCHASLLFFCGHVGTAQQALQPTPSAVNQCGGMMQPTPSAVNQCGVHTAATVCTQPAVCQPSVAQICPTPSAVHQCGGQTAATVCTQPPACHPSVNVICPTPSAVHQCGTLANVPPSGTMHQCCGAQAGGGFPTLQACFPPTTNCMTIPARCGVFTPFGTQ